MIKRLAYFLLPLNVLIDTLLLFSEQLSWLPLLRAFILILLLVFVLFKYRGHSKYYSAILIFVVYCLFQLPFTTDWQKSLIVTLKICIPIASFAIGFQVFNNLYELRKLSISVLLVYLILGANFILSQRFQLGQSVYSDESNFRVGNLADAWNVFTYSVLLAPLVISLFAKEKFLRISSYVGAIGNGLLVLISIKRIAIIGLITGNLIRMYFVPKTVRWMRSVIVFFFVAAIALYFIQDIIMERIELRSSRFESGALEREGRYLESNYVWDEVLSFKVPVKSLFGLEGFNSVGNYADGRFGDRQLHVDYNLIVNTIGIVGLILYVFIFLQISRLMIRVADDWNGDRTIKQTLLSTFWMLLLNQFITSTAGQMYHVSYRLIVFVFLGAIVGIFVKEKSKHLLAK
jgi:hypothetical protein